MVITCEKCNTNFNLDDSLVTETGAKVRCSICKHVFTAYPSVVEPEPEIIDEQTAEASVFAEEMVQDEEEQEESYTETAEMVMPDMESDVESGAEPDGEPEMEPEIESEEDADDLEDLTSMFEIEEEEPVAQTDDDRIPAIEELELDLGGDEELGKDTAEFKEQSRAQADDDSILAIEELELDLGGDAELERDAADLDEGSQKGGEAGDLLFEDHDESEMDDEVFEEFALDLDLEDDMGTGEPGIEAEADDEAVGASESKEPETMETEAEAPPVEEAGDELDLELDVEETADAEADHSEADDLLAIEAEVEESLDMDLEAVGVVEETGDMTEEQAKSEETVAEEFEDDEAEIDFAEVDDLLEMEEESASAEEDAEESLDIDLEAELEIDEEEQGGRAEESAELAEEEQETADLDLSELEDAFESEQEVEDEATEIEEAIDLDFGTELEPDEDGVEAVGDEDIDLSDIEKMIEEEADIVDTEKEEASDVAEETAGEADEAEEEMSLEELSELDQGDAAEEDEDLVDEVVDFGGEEEKPKKKKRMGAMAVAMLVLLLLGGGAVGAYFVLDKMAIDVPYLDDAKKMTISLVDKVPYVKDFLPKQMDDPGNLSISAVDIAGKFVNNAAVGKLFVISGNAKNGYSEPRGLIKITGKLYSQGKQLARTETVFCGNMLSDSELTSLDVASISKRLANRTGDKKENLDIPPGRLVPFMVVFSDLPKNLEEYTIEVVESFPSSKK